MNLHDMLEGDGCPWSDMDPTRAEIADALEYIDDDEAKALGITWGHERAAWEREARERVAQNLAKSMLTNALTLATLDNDLTAISRLKLELAALDLKEECQATVAAVRSVDDLKALIETQRSA